MTGFSGIPMGGKGLNKSGQGLPIELGEKPSIS